MAHSLATPWHTLSRTAHHLCAPCSSSFGAVAWPRILPCPSPPLRTEQAILEDHRRDDSFAKPRFSCYGIWCFTSRRLTIIVSFRGDVHPQNAGRTVLSPYAVDLAGQHLTERFPPWLTLLQPRGTHPCAPPTTFARPAHPLLARSSKTTGATTRSRSLAFPVTAYGASHRGAGPSSSPFAVTFTLKMPVALPYPRMLSMLLGSISPNVFPHGALSCTPVAHTLAHRPLPLRALLILFWRGCLAEGQASYTRRLGSLRQLAIHARNLRYHRILPCPSPPWPTSAGTGAAAPWDFAGKWLAGEQRRAVQRFARLCSLIVGPFIGRGQILPRCSMAVFRRRDAAETKTCAARLEFGGGPDRRRRSGSRRRHL